MDVFALVPQIFMRYDKRMVRHFFPRIRSLFPRVCIIATCVAIAVLFVIFAEYRYRVGLNRYFDSDELSYISWTAHFLKGSLPFRDFLYFCLPGYFIFLFPALLGGTGVFGPLILGRVFAWIVSLIISISLILLSRRQSRGWWNILAGLIILFLPLPADKILEIRPDPLMYLFAFFGMALQMYHMDHPNDRHAESYIIGVGFLYGIAIFIFSKVLVIVGLASLFFALYTVFRPYPSWHKRIVTTIRHGILYAVSVLIIPGISFMWGASLIGVDSMWYYMVRFPVEVNRMMLDYYISPDFFFLDNNLVYGVWGKQIGYQYNHMLWGIGAVWIVIMLIVGLLTFRKVQDLRNIFLPTIGIILAASYYYIPVHHMQYLIPLACFVALFVSDFVGFLYRMSSRWVLTNIIFFGLLGYALFLMYQAFWNVYPTKLAWNNQDTHQELAILDAYIPANTYVYDLICMAYRYPHPAYVNCRPVGQFSMYLSRPLPSVRAALERSNYVYQGSGLRVNTLSIEDQNYVQTHFSPVLSGRLLVRNGVPWEPLQRKAR
jgi:hypothetical protein